MKINEALSPREIDAKKKGTIVPNSGSSILGLFTAQLNQQENSLVEYEQEVQELRKVIDAAGDLLVQEPSLKSFKHFRDALSRLAKTINNEAYRLDKFGGTPQNPRYYEIITIINHEADRLYNLIVQEHKDNMAIIAKVIGIKGLVVDLIT